MKRKHPTVFFLFEAELRSEEVFSFCGFERHEINLWLGPAKTVSAFERRVIPPVTTSGKTAPSRLVFFSNESGGPCTGGLSASASEKSCWKEHRRFGGKRCGRESGAWEKGTWAKEGVDRGL